MQRCLVHWVRSAKKPSGFPADRGTGMAWRGVLGGVMRVRYPRTRGEGKRRIDGGGCVCPLDLGNLVEHCRRTQAAASPRIYRRWIVPFTRVVRPACCIPRHLEVPCVQLARCILARTSKVYVTMDFTSLARARGSLPMQAARVVRVLDFGVRNVSCIRRRLRKHHESSKTDDKRRRRHRPNNAIECAMTWRACDIKIINELSLEDHNDIAHA